MFRSQRAILENIVTDPYSVDLASIGVKSRITDLNDPDTQPARLGGVAPAFAPQRERSQHLRTAHTRFQRQ